MSSTTFQGRRGITSASITRCPGSPLRAGTKNRMDAIAMATVPSSTKRGQGSRRDQPGNTSGPMFRSTRNTQSSAVAAKTTMTTRSSKAIGPRAARSRAITSRPTANRAGARYSTCVISSQAASSMTRPIGNAANSHCPKAMAGASGNSAS